MNDQRIEAILNQLLEQTREQVLPTVYSATMLAGLQELQSLTGAIAEQRDFARQGMPAAPAGWQLVPVERIQIALEAVQNTMLDAYTNAYQECCSRWQGQCCGDPDPAWSAEDQRIMDALSPAQRELSALLAAAPAAPVAQEPVAWQDPDNLDRICSARTMLEAKHTGGATLSALKPLTRALYAAPPAAEQPDTVAVPRDLLAEAESIIDSYAEALRASHAPGGDWDGEEAALDDYEREAGVAAKLRRLLAGGAE